MIGRLIKFVAWIYRMKLALVGAPGGRGDHRRRADFDTNYPFF